MAIRFVSEFRATILASTVNPCTVWGSEEMHQASSVDLN